MFCFAAAAVVSDGVLPTAAYYEPVESYDVAELCVNDRRAIGWVGGQVLRSITNMMLMELAKDIGLKVENRWLTCL